MLDIQRLIGAPTIKTKEIDETTTQFRVEYLPRGFGYTLGNALRRLIIGYDYGGAVTAIKIAGVSHEFSTLAGIKENVIDIMLAIKKLRFHIDESVEKQTWLTMTFDGVGEVTSDKLTLPAGIELQTTDLPLFTITDANVKFTIDIRIERGYGYYSLDYLKQREKENKEKDVGLLLIDNDFTQVASVSYDVEEVIEDFIGGMKDSLVLTVSTISSVVTPQQVLTFVGEALASYAKLFIFDENYINEEAFVEAHELRQSAGPTQDYDMVNVKIMPIDALPLSERTRNALIKNEILYVEDLEQKTKNELLAMKGLGKKALDEIIESLDGLDKTLKQQ